MTTADDGLSIGVALPTREAIVAERPDPAPLLDLAERAEAAGFDSVWAGDSLLARPRLEPLTLLAAVAARTTRVVVGTSVLLPALRHPLPLAHTIATLDQIAGGRLILALGAGFEIPATHAECRAAGVPPGERIGRLLETVRLWRALWDDDNDAPVAFHGKYWQLEDVTLLPRPRQPGGPPLWLAGATERALARTGRLFDGWLPYSPTAAQFGDGLRRVHAAAEETHRDPSKITPALYVTVALDTLASRAEETLRRYIEAYYGLPLEMMAQLQAMYAGTPAGCVDWLDAYLRQGVRHLVVRLATTDPHAALDYAAAELLPRLRRG